MLTWRRLSQEHLQVRGQLDNVVWRSRPKDETVARIPKTGLHLRVLEPQEDGVDIQPREIGGQELVFLLRISCRTVRRI